MVADARLSTGLPGHPKTKKLIKRLGGAAAWNLVCLFLWAAENRSDGDLSGLSDEDIELCVNWSGDDGAFVNALRDVGFIDGEENTSVIHDWMEHNPWAAGAEMRSAKARWNAAKRHHGAAEADRLVPEYAATRIANPPIDDASSNASSNNTADEVQSSSNAPSPSPSPSPTHSVVKASRKRSVKTSMPDDFAVSERVKAWAAERGLTQLPEHLDAFKRKVAANGYTYADWDAAFMEAIREDWAKLRGKTQGGAAVPPSSSRPQWAIDAGFTNRWEAENDGCHEHNAQLFSHGKRTEVAA